jgi:hypothetical protein
MWRANVFKANEISGVCMSIMNNYWSNFTYILVKFWNIKLMCQNDQGLKISCVCCGVVWLRGHD